MLQTIYLDNNSTTPLDPEVVEFTSNILSNFGNPSSPHIFGLEAKVLVEQAREELSKLLGTSPNCIIFTSGATEANNIALQGFSFQKKRIEPDKKPFYISTTIEHSSILKTLSALKERKMIDYSLLETDREGLISIDSLNELISENISKSPLFLSIQLANNEIGTLQDIELISHKFKNDKVYIHSDITQVIGKIPFSFKNNKIDAVSLSGHKFHAPKGIGVLAFRDEEALSLIDPLYFGGSHEKGLRPGTLSVPFICSIGKAAELARENTEKNAKFINELSKALLNKLVSICPDIKLLGPSIDSNKRLPGNLSLIFPKVNAGKMVHELSTKVAFSNSSACLSSNPSGSHVLKALGLEEFEASSVARLGTSHLNTMEEIEKASELILNKIKALRA